MKLHFKKGLLVLAFGIAFLVGREIYYRHWPLSPSLLVTKALSVSAFSSQSVWDPKFLTLHTALTEKMIRFEKGDLCKSLKEIDTKNLTHRQITEALHKRGFRCSLRPLTVSPKDSSQGYLKRDNSITHDLQDKDIAQQDICQDQTQPDCVIRIKPDGFPLNKRSQPHSSKAVLINSMGDPGRYDNEAFKVGAQGQPLPKGPDAKFGLKKCPYRKDQGACTQWIDKIMEEAHPLLKDPQRTP